MENQRVGIGILPTGEQEKELQESLNPLAENFDFDSWAKMVKRQMNKSLQSPFSHYLSK
ncbi:hypothetical protein WH8501_02815 [Crocosphaera watsonii WH 8501]|uniref:Uncharacterized protein n=5 Tax=Crocosphaera watsonii TaxID=263511 RepID=T2JLW4_CROWT|nr:MULTISPECIES: hypothetical protein [Crocosphaera]EHJ10563.1 hypothetical protein CWATWH0003_4672 [Crocosphaera watsonii WH 0003]MCH2243732.1 hypothetical protein [Crocosphaera sp.]NQZ61314.1 hypothetical protein [Crocosphaera sp.]CCQ52146.1 hypothetical protein CWATWH8502_2005 [Crocosphaera watsonii WH 8502]CCQ56488.1 hypothetical protein CWATWH0005_5766 [Crocosphaera watsonii WH 0005]